MTALLGEIELIRASDNSVVMAQIYLGLDERHIRDHELSWRSPMIKAARAAQARCTSKGGKIDLPKLRAEVAQLRLEDVGWDWRQINSLFATRSGCHGLAIECEGHTQGLMLIDTENHASRLAPKGQTIAYVELLTSAPWNRGTFIPTAEFALTGYALIATAISLSRSHFLDGRVGLHSVSGSVGFYEKKCGMSSLGPDAQKKGLVYFEMSTPQADAFLNTLVARRGGP